MASPEQIAVDTNDSSDTTPVRASEHLQWNALADYAREQLKIILGNRFDDAPAMTVEQFPGGHSNLTYLLRFGSQEFVMRRPPFGPVPPRAHDMARECRILQALHPVFPLAPQPYLLCEDPSVIGATFYLMERRHGVVVRNDEPGALKDRPDVRRSVSQAMVDALADLHLIDTDRNGLTALGKPRGFVERQVRGWSERWKGSQTTELPVMDQLARWLIERLPPEAQRPSLLHGDFKLDNVMLDGKDLSRLVAVFDWEMSAVGDPLIDLGILLAYWIHTTPAAQRHSLDAVTRRTGWFSRQEILERYQQRTGDDVTGIKFYEVFAVFKLAVVLQQIFYRYHRGQTDDARFADLDKRVELLAKIATSLAED
jgi:aminoglycoside phosphotransferase (APT) family kinase protein